MMEFDGQFGAVPCEGGICFTHVSIVGDASFIVKQPDGFNADDAFEEVQKYAKEFNEESLAKSLRHRINLRPKVEYLEGFVQITPLDELTQESYKKISRGWREGTTVRLQSLFDSNPLTPNLPRKRYAPVMPAIPDTAIRQYQLFKIEENDGKITYAYEQ